MRVRCSYLLLARSEAEAAGTRAVAVGHGHRRQLPLLEKQEARKGRKCVGRWRCLLGKPWLPVKLTAGEARDAAAPVPRPGRTL